MFVITLGDIIGIAFFCLFAIVAGIVFIHTWWTGRKK